MRQDLGCSICLGSSQFVFEFSVVSGVVAPRARKKHGAQGWAAGIFFFYILILFLFVCSALAEI